MVDNLPFISFIRESASDGYVKSATYNLTTKDFGSQLVQNGNFFGPANITVYNNSPYFIFHDHALNSGGANVLIESGNQWVSEDATDTGHDGWDARLEFGSTGNYHVSSIDAIPFNGMGVEYSFFDGAAWMVETVGSGALDYGYGTSIELNALEEPIIFYYNSVEDNLEMAQKSGNTWEITKLDSVGDVGKYIVSYEQNDTLYLSYLKMLGNDSAEVRLAFKPILEDWEFFILDTLLNFDDTKMGVQALDLVVTDQLYLGMCTTKELSVLGMQKNIGLLVKEPILVSVSSDSSFTQMVDLVLDNEGFIHAVAGMEIDGVDQVLFATNHETILKSSSVQIPTLSYYPNPTSGFVNFNQLVHKLELFDLLGNSVGTWENIEQINLSTFSSGVYMARVGFSTFRIIKR